jgi:hypothetical protein
MDDALDKFKIPFDKYLDWQTDGHGQMGDRLYGIIVHHTAGGGTNDHKVVKNGRPGLDGPLAHCTFERNGRGRLIAAGQCYHAGTGTHPRIGRNNGNLRTLGIEGVSNGTSWSSSQYPEEYPRFAAAFAVEYNLPVEAIIGHKEWTTRKIDPGNWDMNAFRREAKKSFTGGGGTGPSNPVIAATRKHFLLF